MTEDTVTTRLHDALVELEHTAPMPADLIERVIATARTAPPLPSHPQRARRWAAPLAAAVLVAALAAVIVILTTLNGRQSPTAPNSPAGPGPVASWRRYISPHEAFRVKYPAAWSPYPSGIHSSGGNGIVYFSSVHVPSDCHTSTNRGDITTTCATPAVSLQHGDVLIFWTQNATLRRGAGPIAHQPGRSTSIDGHPAKIAISTPGKRSTCARSHGTRQVDIAILEPRMANLVTMNACLSDTSTEIQRLTHAVITSARTARLRR